MRVASLITALFPPGRRLTHSAISHCPSHSTPPPHANSKHPSLIKLYNSLPSLYVQIELRSAGCAGHAVAVWFRPAARSELAFWGACAVLAVWGDEQYFGVREPTRWWPAGNRLAIWSAGRIAVRSTCK